MSQRRFCTFWTVQIWVLYIQNDHWPLQTSVTCCKKRNAPDHLKLTSNNLPFQIFLCSVGKIWDGQETAKSKIMNSLKNLKEKKKIKRKRKRKIWSPSCYRELKLTTKPCTGRTLRARCKIFACEVWACTESKILR